MERVEGIEPSWPVWKTGALPLSYTRSNRFQSAEHTRQRQAAEQRNSMRMPLGTGGRHVGRGPKAEVDPLEPLPAGARRLAGRGSVDPCKSGAEDRSHRGQPELSHRPAAHEQRRPGAPRGVDREIGDTASCPVPRALFALSHVRLCATTEHHFAKTAPLTVAPVPPWRVDTPWIGATGGRPAFRAKIFL